MLIIIGIAEGGLYDAWNPWGFNVNSRCNNQGQNCVLGWANLYHISVNNQPNTLFGSSKFFATANIAKQNAVSTSFNLVKNGTARFAIVDNPYSDNYGGISLKVESVPEPFTMSGILLVGSIGLLLKNKKSLKQKQEATVKA